MYESTGVNGTAKLLTLVKSVFSKSEDLAVLMPLKGPTNKIVFIKLNADLSSRDS
jgi:hypothetical protein